MLTRFFERFRAFAFAILLVTASAVPALAGPFEDAVAQFANDSFSDTAEAVGTLATSGNPLASTPSDRVTTGAFSAFGTATVKGQTVYGQVPCNGAIMRVPLDGGKPELVAWGFRIQGEFAYFSFLP